MIQCTHIIYNNIMFRILSLPRCTLQPDLIYTALCRQCRNSLFCPSRLFFLSVIPLTTFLAYNKNKAHLAPYFILYRVCGSLSAIKLMCIITHKNIISHLLVIVNKTKNRKLILFFYLSPNHITAIYCL